MTLEAGITTRHSAVAYEHLRRQECSSSTNDQIRTKMTQCLRHLKLDAALRSGHKYPHRARHVSRPSVCAGSARLSRSHTFPCGNSNSLTIAPCPSKFKLQLWVTVRARFGHDGLVSVRIYADLQVKNCVAIVTPYDATADSRVGHGAVMCVLAFRVNPPPPQ
ncbi:hypothetical protein J6590_034176 [Homalodisca vitripennis]|nr:hypothetical protein J6590_034176 [Homalodisca vitripennis]